MPEITLSLPAALGLLVMFLVVGAAALYITLQGTHKIQSPTPIPSLTVTPTISPLPTDTSIPSETPTFTPLPPKDYIVQSGDTCYSIAGLFGISASVLITDNNLNSACTNLSVGQHLKVPQPTSTPPPAATVTLAPADATRQACSTVSYTVQANDTLSSISLNYNVPMDAIKSWNGLSTDNVYLNMPLIVPLCMRAATPGPTPTPTNPPPYPAPNLLLPSNGAPFTLADDSVTLQWASVGTLRENERYLVVVEDVTAGTGRKLTDYVTDTKFIVPVTFRPADTLAHTMFWTVTTVRQSGVDDQGNPIWTSAGAASQQRVFTWSGVTAAPTPTK
jgi:LysM repeat protein